MTKACQRELELGREIRFAFLIHKLSKAAREERRSCLNNGGSRGTKRNNNS